MDYFQIILVSLLITLVKQYDTIRRCTEGCYCILNEKHFSCQLDHITDMPLPHSLFTIYTNKGRLKYRTLKTLQFLQFGHVVKIFLKQNNIMKIQVQTFSQLRNLKILDLKENEIESILPETFKNMNIDGLTLSGNKKIRLFHGAFSRLTVKNLYLDDCGLVKLDKNVFDLAVISKILSLKSNKFVSLDINLSNVFQDIPQVLMGKNEKLNCSCKLLWLQKLYKSTKYEKMPDATREYVVPKCKVYQHIEYLDKVSLDHSCSEITFERIKIHIGEQGATMVCRPQSKLNIKSIGWMPPGKIVQHASPKILVNTTSDGVYTCIASNLLGNLDLQVEVTWSEALISRVGLRDRRRHQLTSEQDGDLPRLGNEPPHPPTDSAHFSRSRVTTPPRRASSTPLPSHRADVVALEPDYVGDYRMYTLTELITGIVCAHVATLFTCILVAYVCLRRQRKRRRSRRKRRAAAASCKEQLSAYDDSDPEPMIPKGKHCRKVVHIAAALPRGIQGSDGESVYLNDISLRRMDYVIPR